MVEKEDHPESWRQVAALGSMAGLLDDQRRRLEQARDALKQAWPPEQNKSAAAFVSLIDDLLFNMAANRKTADANAGALSQVLEALRQAKVQIEPLYRAYVEKSDDWVPAWWDNAEDEIDEKARDAMRRAERIVAQPENVIAAPDLYEFKPRNFVDDPIGGAGGSGSGAGGTPLANGGASSGGGGISVPHDPPPPLPVAEAAGPGGRPPPATDVPPGSAGPSLAGVIAPAPSGSPPIGAPPAALPPVAGTGFVPSAPGLVIGGIGAAGGRPAAGGGPRGLPGPTSGQGVSGRGGTPTAKPVTPSWLPPPSGQPNVRGAAGGAGRGTSAQSSMMPALGSPGGQRRTGQGDHDGAFDPDNPWATDQGVAPVIEPSRVHHRHEPGPGVIGWRR